MKAKPKARASPRSRGPSEQDALAIIMDAGDEGILQSEVWKRIKADSREGSRAIIKLERKSLVERKRELHDGRWTYRVLAKYKYSTIDSIIGIPCAFCDLQENCVRDFKCERLTQWLTLATAQTSKHQD